MDLILFIGGTIAFGVIYALRKAGERNKLEEEYRSLLNQLSQNPKNTQLRMAALQAGREYYASCREGGNLTIYDESAINNDINAAGGGS